MKDATIIDEYFINDVPLYNKNIIAMAYSVAKKAQMLDNAGEHRLALDAIKDAKNNICDSNKLAPYTPAVEKALNLLDRLEKYFGTRNDAFEHLDSVLNRQTGIKV